MLCPTVLSATSGREGTFPKLLGLSPQLKMALLVSVGTLESLLPLPAPMFLICGLEMLKMFPAKLGPVFWPPDGREHLQSQSIQRDPFPASFLPLSTASLCRHQHNERPGYCLSPISESSCSCFGLRLITCVMSRFT